MIIASSVFIITIHFSYQLVLPFQFHYHFTFILYLGLERMRRGEERERERESACMCWCIMVTFSLVISSFKPLISSFDFLIQLSRIFNSVSSSDSFVVWIISFCWSWISCNFISEGDLIANTCYNVEVDQSLLL